MKWAADPMVPFRRVEHWPRDLYLIDQPVQREKVPFLQRGLLPTPLLYFRANVFVKKERNGFKLPPLATSRVGIIVRSEDKKKEPLIWFGELSQSSYLIKLSTIYK